MTEKKTRIFLNKDYSTESHFVPKDTELKKSVPLSSGPPWNEYRLLDLEGKYVRSYPYYEIFGNSFFRIIERYCDCGINCNCFKGTPALYKEIEKVFLAIDYSTEEYFMPKDTELKKMSSPNVFGLYKTNGVLIKAIDMNEHLDNPMFNIVFKESKYFEITIPSIETLRKGYVYRNIGGTLHRDLRNDIEYIEHYKTGSWFPNIDDANKAIRYIQCKEYINQLIEYCKKNSYCHAEIYFYVIERKPFTKKLQYVKYERNKHNVTLFRKPIFNNEGSAMIFIEKFDPYWIDTFHDMIYEEKLV